MQNLINKAPDLKKLEFWAATSMFVFTIFYLVSSAIKTDGSMAWSYNAERIEQTRIELNYNQYYFFPRLVRYITFYLSFLLLNFKVIPGLLKKQHLFRNISLAVVTFLLAWIIIATADTYLRNYIFLQFKTDKEAYYYIFQSSFFYAAWLMLMLSLYNVIKYGAEYLFENSEKLQSEYKITRDGITAFVVWMISVFILLIISADEVIIASWFIAIPFAVVLYWYSFSRLIPESINRDKPLRIYLLKIFLVMAVAALPVFFVVLVFTQRNGMAVVVTIFNTAFQLLITAPVSWVIFKRQQKGNEEIYSLKTALGRSNANLDFLRSQINPHFLFNALNTIYGTALQEKAERTSEGIEKLGDMMRFMLQENMQEKISLAREIEYLENYISLQKLRTDPSPEVNINSEIATPDTFLQVAPMLLIPFVENAFKHGISLREPSYIRISLQIRESTVYFDVYNSIHTKVQHDPEKNKSGIGLNNVKQRLQLIYPRKHELIIRETVKEFFIHLTIELD